MKIITYIIDDQIISQKLMLKSCTIEIDKAERETDALKIDVIIFQVASD